MFLRFLFYTLYLLTNSIVLMPFSALLLFFVRLFIKITLPPYLHSHYTWLIKAQWIAIPGALMLYTSDFFITFVVDVIFLPYLGNNFIIAFFGAGVACILLLAIWLMNIFVLWDRTKAGIRLIKEEKPYL